MLKLGQVDHMTAYSLGYHTEFINLWDIGINRFFITSDYSLQKNLLFMADRVSCYVSLESSSNKASNFVFLHFRPSATFFGFDLKFTLTFKNIFFLFKPLYTV